MPELTEEQRNLGRERAIAWQKRDSQEKRAKIRALLDQGMTQAEVARELGVTRQNISILVKRMRNG